MAVARDGIPSEKPAAGCPRLYRYAQLDLKAVTGTSKEAKRQHRRHRIDGHGLSASSRLARS
jgi:hypothetical protein